MGLGGFAIGAPIADFYYVDGPFVKMTTNFPAGKAVNLDVPKILESGHRPKAIVIDGRTDTIDYLRSRNLVAEYTFEPEFIYAYRHRNWTDAIRFKRQSVFLLRDHS
jgi:hypothetical protein